MRLILLKFCYAVEIGAYLAYVGHHKATNCRGIALIKQDELKHMVHIKNILAKYGTSPSLIFNLMFLVIGHLVRVSCRFTNECLLDWIAGIMELFNVVSYDFMAKLFPDHKDRFEDMACQEAAHRMFLEDRRYFHG